MKRDEIPEAERCTRCLGLGQVVIASHDCGDGVYNDDFDTCPRCQGSGREPAVEAA